MLLQPPLLKFMCSMNAIKDLLEAIAIARRTFPAYRWKVMNNSQKKASEINWKGKKTNPEKMLEDINSMLIQQTTIIRQYEPQFKPISCKKETKKVYLAGGLDGLYQYIKILEESICKYRYLQMPYY